MITGAIMKRDLEVLHPLTPEDWPDIVPDFSFYVQNPFCYPIKIISDNRIVGVGASIVFENTAWLGHIIVAPEYRNLGIGYRVTEELLKIVYSKNIKTCLLVATDLGKPVYKKLGFQEIGEYVFLEKEELYLPWNHSGSKIIPYDPEYRQEIYDLDEMIMGERRKVLLDLFMENMFLYKNDKRIEGYFIPGLKECPVYAITSESGLALLNQRNVKMNNLVLPKDNTQALNFALKNGFKDTKRRGTRMVAGKNIPWKGNFVYGRIGGNMG